MFRRTATALIGMTLLSLPTATHAESRVRHDARHDVVAPSGHARPANASSDLTRVAVHHRARVVSVTAQVRDLAARPRTTILVTHIVTPDRTYTVNVTRWEAQSARIFLVSSEDVPLKCRGDRGGMDAKRDVVRFAVPRRCLGRPAWVRVGVGLISFRGTQGLSDDALTAGPADINDPTLGRRLSRG